MIDSFLRVDPNRRKWFHLVLWWESRRLWYNLLMIVFGLLSFMISFITIPAYYILIGLSLNLYYTLGWILEIPIALFSSDEILKIRFAK